MLRKAVFWIHLCCGVAAGLVILMMSFTGVVLTYERQLLARQDKASYFQEPDVGEVRLPVDALLELAETNSRITPTVITLASDPAAPAVLREGRSDSVHMNPYTGNIYTPHDPALDEFFGTMTGLHRWFNISGENRSTARAITGISNLMFLFLVISGIYLWLPPVFRWSAMRLRLWFHPNARNAAARDFNWHHVFGIWAAIPLVVIVATATVFNYQWANNLVYQLAGDAPPQRGSGSTQGQESRTENVVVDADAFQTLDDLFVQAEQAVSANLGGWNTLTMNIPDSNASDVSFSVDQGNGGQPQKRHNMSLNRYTGNVVDWAPFESQSAGRQARSWVRFLHTGEALGIAGQTLAGLASLAGVLMVWTGLSLSIRRLRGFIARTARRQSRSRDGLTADS